MTRKLKDLIYLAWEHYQGAGNEAGGALHIVLDDGNVEKSHVEWCRNYAASEGDVDAVMLCDELLAVSERMRERLYQNYNLYRSSAPEPIL